MTALQSPAQVRNLVLVLGDQLAGESAALDGFDAARDALWMAEVTGEPEHGWTSPPRLAVLLAAMRHFRVAQEKRGRRVSAAELDDAKNTQSLAGELARAVAALQPGRIVMVPAGEWRVPRAIKASGGASAAAEADGLLPRPG